MTPLESAVVTPAVRCTRTETRAALLLNACVRFVLKLASADPEDESISTAVQAIVDVMISKIYSTGVCECKKERTDRLFQNSETVSVFLSTTRTNCRHVSKPRSSVYHVAENVEPIGLGHDLLHFADQQV